MNLLRRLLQATAFAWSLGFASLIPWANAWAQVPETPTPKTDSQPSTVTGWHVGITPYLWFAGVHGTSGALDHDASAHVEAGCRYLSVDYRPNGNALFVYDVNMPGLVIGATFNVK